MKLSLTFEDEYTGNKWEIPFKVNDHLFVMVGEPQGPYGRILKAIGGLPPLLNIQALLASILTIADDRLIKSEAKIIPIRGSGHDNARTAETS